MDQKDESRLEFLMEMSERQISAREFFSNVLLDSLSRNFGLDQMLILCFDPDNHFQSWIDHSGILPDTKGHPYRDFAQGDVIRLRAYQEALRDHLTYFNISPRLYHSTKIIDALEYDHSAYVRFLEENFRAHYSVTMALGINAYIQLLVWKTKEQGDFSPLEIQELERIYTYVANAYKNFKKHEQSKIIANIQDEIIASGEKAYLITNDLHHVLSCNRTAFHYLQEVFGASLVTPPESMSPVPWVPLLLGGQEDAATSQKVKTTVINEFVFKIYPYFQRYSHGIVDRYYWITIVKQEQTVSPIPQGMGSLTKSEQKVAKLLGEGLTYQAIADELVISYHTVKNHVQNIYAKCGVKSRFELSQVIQSQGNREHSL